MELSELVGAFAAGIVAADSTSPVAAPSRTGRTYQPGIGPHSERETVRLVLASWRFGIASVEREVPYPSMPRIRCDMVAADDPGWAVEFKMLRLIGDNGKPNDNMLMHILSPYPAHRSALTDVDKLLASGFAERKALVVFGYDHPSWPMDPAIDALRLLGAERAQMVECDFARFDGLMHSVHREGRVFGWELLDR